MLQGWGGLEMNAIIKTWTPEEFEDYLNDTNGRRIRWNTHYTHIERAPIGYCMLSMSKRCIMA